MSLDARLREYGQEHVLRYWDELAPGQRDGLARQIESLDLGELKSLYERRDEKIHVPAIESIRPLPRPYEGGADRLRAIGEAAFQRGEVAFVVVAGGQGSRLGFDKPKGMFSIGPVSGKSLFQIHVEKVLALSRRFGRDLPLLVMTSSVTHDETVAYFEENAHFGMPAESVKFFQQRSMPALDLATGRLLMEAKDRLFLGPNGHGGTITGLAENGLFDWLTQRGVTTLSYFQVDNPIVHLADYVFLGRHLEQRAEVSSKVVEKQFPTEKLGNLALIDSRCGIIEYSDLPESLARATDEHGRPTFWAGNPAIHLFDIAFLRRMTDDADAMPWHLAHKKVPFLNEAGQLETPVKENALKFERFIFDILPRADRWTIAATTRPDEFEPVKNATGPESPDTARQAISELAGRWLEFHGVAVPRKDGRVTTSIEISPLVALEASDLTGRVSPATIVEGPLYIG